MAESKDLSGTEAIVAGFLVKGDMFDTGCGFFAAVTSTRLIESLRPQDQDWVEFQYAVADSISTRTYPFKTPVRVYTGRIEAAQSTSVLV